MKLDIYGDIQGFLFLSFSIIPVNPSDGTYDGALSIG
jgi:hypothetical protein